MQTATSAHVCTHKTPAEYLENLPAWDGVARLDTWLPHVLDESPESAGMHRMQYLSLVGRQWLLAMVRRVLERGWKFDHCPVLEGPGGLGKSTLLNVLAGKEFFSDNHLDMALGHATLREIDGIWLYEIAELSMYSKADKESIKAFISTAQDYLRAPYQKDPGFTPRQFVVASTTNEATWRKNIAGRHFWPVPVRNQINTDWLATHRDQLFAEAKAHMQKAEPIQELGDHPGYPHLSRK